MTVKSAAWRLALIRWSPRTLFNTPDGNKAGSTGVRTNFGVHWDSSKFQIVRLPAEPAVSVFGNTGNGYQRVAASREFSIAVNVPLVNVVERMSARNVGSTAHMSSFTDRRTIKNCLMSARNMRAAAHAPCSQRALSMFTAQILNAKSTDFTLFTDRWRRWRWLVDEGAELSRIFVLLTDLYNQRFRFVHSITKKQGTLVMAITHSFHDIRVDINDIWLN